MWLPTYVIMEKYVEIHFCFTLGTRWKVSDQHRVSATLAMEQVCDSCVCRWVGELQGLSECGGKGRSPFLCWGSYVNIIAVNLSQLRIILLHYLSQSESVIY
jgi:hypothetical protein